MATKAFKNEKIQHFKSQFEKASAAYVADYRGYSVEQITNLRRLLQKENCDLTVTKNTLAKIAIKGTSYEPLSKVLEGPTAIAFGFGDQVAPAKILSKFIKDSKKGEIIAACLDGELYDAKQTKYLANLPSKEELYAKILGSINSPASGIVGCVNGVMASLVRAVDAVAKQKQA